jgi:membrane protein implicated in regulation of membrane protease activity
MTENTNRSNGHTEPRNAGGEDAVLIALALFAAAISIGGIAMLTGPVYTALWGPAVLAPALIHLLRRWRAPRREDHRAALRLMARQITAAESGGRPC